MLGLPLAFTFVSFRRCFRASSRLLGLLYPLGLLGFYMCQDFWGSSAGTSWDPHLYDFLGFHVFPLLGHVHLLGYGFLRSTSVRSVRTSRILIL